jgi:hypothetical protein
MAESALRISVDMSEVNATTAFLKRNVAVLRDNPHLYESVSQLISAGKAVIFLSSKTGLVGEMSYPMLEIVSLMKHNGCR